MVFLFSVFVLTSINKEKDDQVFVKVSIFYVYIWGIGDVAEEVISFLVSSVVFLHYVATQHQIKHKNSSLRIHGMCTINIVK